MRNGNGENNSNRRTTHTIYTYFVYKWTNQSQNSLLVFFGILFLMFFVFFLLTSSVSHHGVFFGATNESQHFISFPLFLHIFLIGIFTACMIVFGRVRTLTGLNRDRACACACVWVWMYDFILLTISNFKYKWAHWILFSAIHIPDRFSFRFVMNYKHECACTNRIETEYNRKWTGMNTKNDQEFCFLLICDIDFEIEQWMIAYRETESMQQTNIKLNRIQ